MEFPIIKEFFFNISLKTFAIKTDFTNKVD